MAPRNPPSFLQAGSHPAEHDRLLTKSLMSFEGPVGAGDLAVSENGTPNMSVNVAAGAAFIHGSESAFQGMYHVVNDATHNVTIAASDPTNPRIDLIVARVRDATYSGATNSFAIEAVTGTAAPSPSAPSVPNNAIVLAEVAVAASASSIVNANITDRRITAPLRGQKIMQQAIGGGPTSGTNELTVATLNIPAQPVGYTLVCDAVTTWFNDTAADAFVLAIKVDGVTKGEVENRHYSGGINDRKPYVIPSTMAVDIAANTACVVTATMRRVIGSGTIQREPGMSHLLTAHLLFG